ncbi:enoyl-CoA hydratase-related protein [Actinomadura rugatobispora]|uniref:Enoyl-CoA hydratase-related protein n=1 Tax=Actinomadura rugatobispora TaxID=1994 RepID=A0ABW0ZZW9_9ACTN|nr:crotonase/enoyl-CoA hydratase family protein [Actinomadura rugatobispora]
MTASLTDGGPVAGGGELLVTGHGPVRVLTLNRPRSMNAITTGLARRFKRALAAADADPAVRAIVITGSGERAFCAGGDLHELAGRADPSVPGPRVVSELVRDRIATPVIAAVNGLAYGGGLELALACDLVVSGEHARFALPEVKRGVLASGGGLVRLPGIVGTRRALQLLLTGEPIDAATALEWGLVNQVVRPAETLTTAVELGSSIAANAPLAVRASKAVAHVSARLPEPEAWALNDTSHDEIAKSHDALEGPRAFSEKRPPRWSGR